MSILDVSVREGICRLRLDRPETRNAWTAETGERMTQTLETLAHDDAVRVVILTGAGKGFCSGVDLRGHFDIDPDGVSDLRGMHHRRFQPAILAMRRLPKPIIAAVNGAAVGYGCSLLLASDFVLMARSAKLIFAFSKIGLVPDGGATAMLAERVGRLRATEIMMLARDLSAEDALRDGLVSRVIEDERLEAEATALAEELARGPTRSYAAIKEALHRWTLQDLARQMELEGDLLQRLAHTRDYVEGKAAFVERRPARFVGA